MKTLNKKGVIMIRDPEKMLSLGRTVSVSRELLREAKYHDILIEDAKNNYLMIFL